VFAKRKFKMNEQIKKIAEQAGIYKLNLSDETEYWIMEKFAELIIKDCITLNKQELSFNAFERMQKVYTEHFGVEE
jgi:hypothetical protein